MAQNLQIQPVPGPFPWTLVIIGAVAAIGLYFLASGDDHEDYADDEYEDEEENDLTDDDEEDEEAEESPNEAT
jgi:hypothetical protein